MDILSGETELILRYNEDVTDRPINENVMANDVTDELTH
jgi:hypothetical protein